MPNQIECFRPVCRWADALAAVREIPAAVQGAFHLFRTGRPGPVALSIPTDVLNAPVAAQAHAGWRGRRPPCDVGLIEEAARYLARAERPAPRRRGRRHRGGRDGELPALARRLRAPVITSVMGRGAIAETDPLWLGVLPNRRATQDALEAADVVLSVGCRFSHRSTKGLLLNLSFRPDQALIQIDLDPRTIGRMHVPALGIVGDARDGLAGFWRAVPAGAPAAALGLAALRRARDARHPRYTDGHRRAAAGAPRGRAGGRDLRRRPDGPQLLDGVAPPRPRAPDVPLPDRLGDARLWRAGRDRGQGRAAGSARWSWSSATGGSSLRGAELATAAKYHLPVVFVVMNDQDYGAIRYLQTRLYGRTGEHALGGPDVLALARAFGVEAYRAPDDDALRSTLDKALALGGPALIEVPVAVEPPWDL